MAAWDRFIVWLCARPRGTVTVGALLILASAALAPGIRFSSDATASLPAVSPQVKAWLDLSRRFDAFNALIIGLEEPQGPFTADGLQRVKRLTGRLAALKAEGVLSVSSVTNVDSIHEAEDGSLETELLVPSIPEAPAELEALRQRVAADVQVSGALISRDQQGYLLLLRADPRRDAAELAQKVEQAVEAERGPMGAYYFGGPFFSRVITRGVYAKLVWLVPVFVLLLLGVTFVLVRRAAAIALVIGATVATLVLWLGLMRALGQELTITSLTALLVLAVVAMLAFARGLEARVASASAPPLPFGVVAAVAAGGFASLALTREPIAFLASFGWALSIGALATLLAGVLVFAPLAARLSAPAPQPASPVSAGRPALAAGLALLALVATGALAARAPFYATPQRMFSPGDEIGRSLAYFDRRFGGPDFIQVDFRGDLKDPAVAARLLRLTDLLEGSGAFRDVRTVAQVLGFLAQGFGGVHRIPAARETLGNLWFFLEGRGDVRNLVSDGRDEAMAVLRVPSTPDRPIAELVHEVDQAVAKSLQTGAPGAKLRLLALAKAFHVALAEGKVGEVLAAPLPDVHAAVEERLKAWLASPDSPYAPTDEEWTRLEAALGAADREKALAEACAGFTGLGDPEHAGQLVESVLARVRDLELDLRSAAIADRLWEGAAVPEPLKLRARGVIADVLDPPPGAGEKAEVSVTGLPVVADQIERDLLGGLRRALVLLVVLGAIVLLALSRQPWLALRAGVEAALATALTLAVAGALGPGVDSGSAPLFLLPPLASLLLGGPAPGAPAIRLPAAFLLGLGAASASLVLIGLPPVTRIGAAVAIGLLAVVAVDAIARRIAPLAAPKA